MRFVAVGCSGSAPGPDSAASCYLVQAEHGGRTWNVVLDLGNGALGPLQRHLDPRNVDAVVLSHLHPDHCLDICGLYVMLTYGPGGTRTTRLPVYAPDGGSQRLARAYGVEEPQPLDDRLDFRVLRPRETFTVGPFTLTPVPAYHPVEAYGVRIAADGAVLAYTGDTDACPQLVELFHDARLALVDCAFVDGRDDARGIHMSGSRAARAALDAGGVERLMLTHIPSWTDPKVCHDQAAATWPGAVEIAEPGRIYEL